IYSLPAGRGATHRRAARHPGLRATGRAAEPARRAERLPVPDALPARPGYLRDGGAGATGGRGPPRGLSLRLRRAPDLELPSPPIQEEREHLRALEQAGHLDELLGAVRAVAARPHTVERRCDSRGVIAVGAATGLDGADVHAEVTAHR